MAISPGMMGSPAWSTIICRSRERVPSSWSSYQEALMSSSMELKPEELSS